MQERPTSKRVTTSILIGLVFITLAAFMAMGVFLTQGKAQTHEFRDIFSDFDGDGDVDLIVKAEIIVNGDSPFLREIYRPEAPTATPAPVIQPTISAPQPPVGEGGPVDRSGDWGLTEGWPNQIVQWEIFISEAARQFYIDPDIIAAIILKESQGDPTLRGQDGELGLMQIMPRFHSCATYEPRANIFCGTSILADNIQYYSGDIRTALAAYNAGKNNVAGGQQYATVVLGTLNHYVGK